MRETRVNLKHLLEDIRDGYVLPIEEAIVTELVANSLDSRASRIEFFIDSTEGKFTICDNGQGMKRGMIKDYHDIAATTKVRGRGIGFAGIGAKLSLLIAKSVITETKGGHGSHCATQWYLMADTRAPWKFIPSSGKVTTPRGTAVTIELLDLQSPLLSSQFISKTIKKHFYPLLHSQFINSILKNIYKKGVNFFINREEIKLKDFDFFEIPRTFRVTLGKRWKELAGFGYLVKTRQSFPIELSGIGISTYGKVIKQGWDWIGVFPKSIFQIHGMVEIPALSQILTTSKNDFLKDATSLKKYYRYRKAIQEAILPILGELGEERVSFERDLKRLRPLEREIKRTLRYILKDFPELTPLVEIRRAVKGGIISEADFPQVGIIQEGLKELEEKVKEEELAEDSEKPSEEKREREKKKGVPGLTIGFEKNPAQFDLARIVKNTIWVNTAHPAYQKAQKENLEEYHLLLCVAWALSQFIEEDRSPQDFISQFFASWSREQDSGKTLEIFKENKQN